MNTAIEKLFQEIGKEASILAEGSPDRLLVYAEVEDGVVSADVFYVDVLSKTVRFRFCSDSLQGLLQSLWEEWQAHPGNREWRAICYVLDGGEFTIDLVYPDQVNHNEDVADRRPRAVTKYFGNTTVDYSRP